MTVVKIMCSVTKIVNCMWIYARIYMFPIGSTLKIGPIITIRRQNPKEKVLDLGLRLLIHKSIKKNKK